MESQDTRSHDRFQPVAGFRMVFDPACSQPGVPKKHQCSDCHFCQGCSESRCQACRGGKDGCRGSSARKLSVREQICLYEAINRGVKQDD
jgi:hypothetical protein